MEWNYEYTPEELMLRVWDQEELRKLINRRSYYIANDWRRRELDELWVQDKALRKSATFGGNWGYYIGMDEITRWYVLEHNQHEYDALKRFSDANSAVEYDKKNLRKGLMILHPINTPLIKIAGDGKTARGMFYSIGVECHGAPDGGEAYWMNEKVAADFVKENGRWYIWHMVVSNDFTIPVGTAMSDMDLYPVENDNRSREFFGNPTKPMTVHDARFNWSDDYPTFPKDYETFDIKESYAPEGHPIFNEKGGKWR